MPSFFDFSLGPRLPKTERAFQNNLTEPDEIGRSVLIMPSGDAAPTEGYDVVSKTIAIS